jgi:hypothetical protein
MPRKDRSAKLNHRDRVLATHVTAHLMGARIMAAHMTGQPMSPELILPELDIAAGIAVQLLRAVDRRLSPKERQQAKERGGALDLRHGGRY